MPHRSVVVNVNRLDEHIAKDLASLLPDTAAFIEAFRNAGWRIVLADWHNLALDTGLWSKVYDLDERRILETTALEDLADLAVVRSVGSVEAKFHEIGNYFDLLHDRLNARAINHPQAMKFGRDKKYIAFLAGRGLPTIPTRSFEANVTLTSLLQSTSEWPPEAAIIKPITGEAGNSCVLLNSVDEAFLRWKEDKVGGWLVQPFIPEVKEGERSFVFARGQCFYGVRKIPHSAEFKVNSRWEPRYELCHITTGELKIATEIAAAWPFPLHTWRLDLVGSVESPKIMEVETVNPGFYIGKLELGAFQESLFEQIITLAGEIS